LYADIGRGNVDISLC